MAYTTGRCTNEMFCSLASGQQIVRVPLEGSFVCPQCGKPLAPPLLKAAKRNLMVPALIGGGALAVIGGGLFAAGSLITHGQPSAPQVLAAATPSRPVPPPAPAKTEALVQPPAILPAQPKPAVQPKTEPAVTMAATAPSAPAAPVLQPVPKPAPSIPVMPPPASKAPVHLAMMEMQQAVTTRAQAEAQAKAAAEAQAQQQAAAAAQARAEARAADLAKRAQQAAAQQAAAQQAAAKKKAADLAKAAEAEAREKQLAAAAKAQPEPVPAPKPVAPVAVAAAGPSHPFSASAIAGGAPRYPSSYESAGRSGVVTVSCVITEGGNPSDCHVVRSQGGPGFGDAVMSWLHNGGVRFAPILVNGQAVSERHQWSMHFQP